MSLTLQQAADLFGADFLGPDQIEKAFGIKIIAVPDIPFTPEELKDANSRDEVLILYTNQAPDGQPLTMEKMMTFLQPKFNSEGKGDVLRNTDWCKDKEDFFKKEVPKARWRLVSKGLIPNSTNQSYLQQTESLSNYLKNIVFKDQPIPTEFQEALEEYERQKGEIADLLGSNWQEAGKRLEALKLNQLVRLSPVEDTYFSLAYFQNTGDRLLPDTVNWTNRRTPLGHFVYLGRFSLRGVGVVCGLPGPRSPDIGVRFAR